MKRPIPNLLLSLASIAVLFVVLELALALFSPHKILIRSYHEQYHPIMGWVNKPDVRGSFYRGNRSLFFRRTHNGHGLRGLTDIPYQKRPGVKRVLLVGDSFFWGYAVNDEAVLSELLRQKVGPGVEIINGAVPGYATDQELLWLTEEGLKYQPDLVILGCFPGNDLDEISHSINYGYPKPFFSLDDKGLLLNNVPVPDSRETRRKAFEAPDTLFAKLKSFLRHRTHIYPFLAARINKLPGVRKFLVAWGVGDEFTSQLPGIPNATLKPEKVQPLFEALLGQIKAASKDAGADFLLLFIPEKELTPGAAALYKGTQQGAEDRNTDYSRYLARFTASRQIPYLDLLPSVRQRQKEGEALYTPSSFDHHWTPAGHRMAAEAIVQQLKRSPLGAAIKP